METFTAIIEMTIDKLIWDNGAVFRDGIRCWESNASGYRVAKCDSYANFTSSSHLIELICDLLRLVGSSSFAATYSHGDNIQEYVFNSSEMLEFKELFDQSGWGVWAIASGSAAPNTDDLIDLFYFVKPSGFAVFIDLDDGMVVACPSAVISGAVSK